MKRFYPGDLEFTLDRFGSLPMEYVIQAVIKGRKVQMEELHYQERPIAALHATLYNVNRDSKKQKQPAKTEEFCMYASKEDLKLPSERYGAAMNALIQQRLWPSWALFCYKELAAGAGPVAPSVLAFMHEDAIVLAPSDTGSGAMVGLLIAREAASGKKLLMQSPCGKQATIAIPLVDTKFIAQEDVELTVVR